MSLGLPSSGHTNSAFRGPSKASGFPAWKKGCWGSEKSRLKGHTGGQQLFKVPSGLARPSIHPSAQICLQITPSPLLISPSKL